MARDESNDREPLRSDAGGMGSATGSPAGGSGTDEPSSRDRLEAAIRRGEALLSAVSGGPEVRPVASTAVVVIGSCGQGGEAAGSGGESTGRPVVPPLAHARPRRLSPAEEDELNQLLRRAFADAGEGRGPGPSESCPEAGEAGEAAEAGGESKAGCGDQPVEGGEVGGESGAADGFERADEAEASPAPPPPGSDDGDAQPAPGGAPESVQASAGSVLSLPSVKNGGAGTGSEFGGSPAEAPKHALPKPFFPSAGKLQISYKNGGYSSKFQPGGKAQPIGKPGDDDGEDDDGDGHAPASGIVLPS